MDIFAYTYMVRALIIGGILSIIIPLIGVVVVNKKISVIGDALSHVSLAGVLLGLILGRSPIIGALITCVIAGLLLEYIRKKIPHYTEMAVSIIMSTGIAVASLLTGFVKTNVNLESFLFGSILTIPDDEFKLIIYMSIIILLVFIYLYKDLMHISFDETSARLSGINVDLTNIIFMILVAMSISIFSRAVGVLIISSLMVLPVACAMQFRKGYSKTVIYSILFGIFFTITGLILSFYFPLKPSGSIVIIAVITLIFLLVFKNKKV